MSTDFQNNRVNIYNDNIGGVSLIQSMGDDLTIVNAARASLDKVSTEWSDREERLSSFLIREGHTSTTEHNVLTFWIKVPMFVARQQMRHRTFSYNEISRRYTSDKIEFYYPQEMRMQDTKNRQASLDETFNPVIEFDPYDHPQFLKLDSVSAIKNHVKESVKLYDKMIDKGIAREQARMILPQNLYTTYWATGSLHNWVNSFVAKRDHPDAQWEIKLLAREISRQIQALWPKAHENFVKHGKIPDLNSPI
jgi:thymidylate synthase (FAD)